MSYESSPPVAPASLLLHVGYHKTGSTFLQTNVFDQPERGFSTAVGRPRHHIVADFAEPDVYAFEAQAVRASYEPHLQRVRAAGLTPVVSHERLSGYPANGGHDRAMIAERLREVFGEARVLIVLREQAALIRSMYSQYVTDGGDLPLEGFLRRPEPCLGRMPYFRFSFYEFDRLVSHYQKLFGRRNVLVLPFEMFTRSPQAFVERIGLFCGHAQPPLASTRPVNDRRPFLMQATQRFANRHLSRNELSPGALVSVPRLAKRFGRLRPLFDVLSPAAVERRLDARLRARIADAVGTRYAESNARTSELTGLDLSAFGYPSATPETLSVRSAACVSPSS